MRTGDSWHMDEGLSTIGGAQRYRWRTVDPERDMRDIPVQARREKRAAVRVLRKLLRRLAHLPRMPIIAKLASDRAARRDVLSGVEHRRHTGRRSHAENTRQST